ncbi:MAG: cation efflux protein, CzcI family [Pseudomonadota bacterium]
MRRWLLIFLVVLLPMQLSWAAVASYCQHEIATTAQHVGHHEHQHEADAASANNSDTGTSPTAMGAVDVDCGTCHAGCCTVMLQSLNLVVAKLPSETHSASALRLTSQPASVPERPNWADLA